MASAFRKSETKSETSGMMRHISIWILVASIATQGCGNPTSTPEELLWFQKRNGCVFHPAQGAMSPALLHKASSDSALPLMHCSMQSVSCCIPPLATALDSKVRAWVVFNPSGQMPVDTLPRIFLIPSEWMRRDCSVVESFIFARPWFCDIRQLATLAVKSKVRYKQFTKVIHKSPN